MSTLDGWPEDERDHIEYWEPGDAHEVRNDELWDGRFADEVRRCTLNPHCKTGPLPADRLWTVKVHHARDPKGYLYSLCWPCLGRFKQDPEPFEDDPPAPICPVHFTKMLGGVCDLCD